MLRNSGHHHNVSRGALKVQGVRSIVADRYIIIEHFLDTATVEAVQRQHTIRQRRRALLHSAGADVQDIFLTLTETGDRREYDVAVTALNNYYFVPKVNNALARQVFHGINPAAGETIQQFATRLKKAALDCAYRAETDNNIRDAILWKCPSIYQTSTT